jgi:hypothetical protein
MQVRKDLHVGSANGAMYPKACLRRGLSSVLELRSVYLLLDGRSTSDLMRNRSGAVQQVGNLRTLLAIDRALREVEVLVTNGSGSAVEFGARALGGVALRGCFCTDLLVRGCMNIFLCVCVSTLESI